jgi:hypothetical protein
MLVLLQSDPPVVACVAAAAFIDAVAAVAELHAVLGEFRVLALLRSTESPPVNDAPAAATAHTSATAAAADSAAAELFVFGLAG